MDGNKKIRGIVLAGILTLAITACKVQKPGYVGLYVDNLTSVNDSIDPREASMVDTAMTNVVDTTAGIETELTVFLSPSEKLFNMSSESAYRYEVNEMLKSISDSIQLMRFQIIELQNQHIFKPDANLLGKGIRNVQPLDSLPELELRQLIQLQYDTIVMLGNQISNFKKYAALKADTIYNIKEIVTQPKGDSLQTDYKTTQLLDAENDTIAFLAKQVHELQNKRSIIKDTIYVFKETAELPALENRQTDPATLRLIKAKDEQIQVLQNQLTAMESAATLNPQQTQITRESAQAQPLGSQQTDHVTRQLLMSKDQQIQMLQNQLNEMQIAAIRNPRQTQVTSEKEQAQPLDSQQTDSMTLQLLRASNDTILYLQSQLYKLRLQSPKKDSVIVENEGKEIQPAKELVSGQKTSEIFQALQDSIRLLKTRVSGLKEQIPPGMDTAALSGKDNIEVPSPAIHDTTLLVTFYELGEIKPLQEDSIFKQIKELCSNKNVTKIALSGYTDSSGNELINKEITNMRLNYLLENIIPWIAKEKVFFQNFGDAYASDKVVMDERRIEIRIHTK